MQEALAAAENESHPLEHIYYTTVTAQSPGSNIQQSQEAKLSDNEVFVDGDDMGVQQTENGESVYDNNRYG